jgi:uncharacterized protein (TIGR02145 family)
MKKSLLCAAFIAGSFIGIAQVGIGTKNPAASAALEIESTTKGLLLPRMTTTERNGISTPVAGLVIYNTTANGLQWFDGTVWYDSRTQTTDDPFTIDAPEDNYNLTLGAVTYNGTSVIDATGIGYNGEAVPSASTITVQLTNNAASSQNYALSATDEQGSGLIYAASGTIAAETTISVILKPNEVVMPDFESGVLTMDLLGTRSALYLLPRIDIKSIPASVTTVTDLVYGTQIWMDRNLGAKRVAAEIDDVFSYGNYYQWGRAGDGHEITVWNGTTQNTGRGLADTTATLAADDIPEHDNFITVNTRPNNWLADPAASDVATLWATASQGPCPANYHVPTQMEWETADEYPTGYNIFVNTLKLPRSGHRGTANGTLSTSVGTRGHYWSSSVFGTSGHSLMFNDDYIIPYNTNDRANGFTVRCLKD